MRYCIIGLIIYAEILFLAIEKPIIVNTILNIYSKCRSLSGIDFWSIIRSNFFLPSWKRKSQSTFNSSRSFWKNNYRFIFFLERFRARSCYNVLTPLALELVCWVTYRRCSFGSLRR